MSSLGPGLPVICCKEIVNTVGQGGSFGTSVACGFAHVVDSASRNTRMTTCSMTSVLRGLLLPRGEDACLSHQDTSACSRIMLPRVGKPRLQQRSMQPSSATQSGCCTKTRVDNPLPLIITPLIINTPQIWYTIIYWEYSLLGGWGGLLLGGGD